MKKTLFLILLLVAVINVLIGQQRNDSEFVQLDSQPTFYGGLDSLNSFLIRNVHYPDDAIVERIEGTVLVKFIVEPSGSVNLSTLKIIKSLSASCDKEALRVVSMLPKWKPALKNKKAVSASFILPLSFTLTGDEKIQKLSAYKVVKPIKASIKPNPVRNYSAWQVYENHDLNNVVGKVKPGDTVSVIGWDYHLYLIETKTFRGYISFNAVQPNTTLDSLAVLVSNYSNIEQCQFFKPHEPKARLVLEVSKKEVYVGECVTASLSFDVEATNKFRIQFISLAEQLLELQSTVLHFDKCWKTVHRIDEVVSEAKTIDKKLFYSYLIYKGSYCPTSTENISFPSIPLNMQVFMGATGYVWDTIKFNSTPITIKVKPIPATLKPSAFDLFKMVGKYSMTDSLLSDDVSVGQPVTYKVTLQSQGLTFPIQPPGFSMTNAKIDLVDINNNDTIIENTLHSSRTFLYSVTFNAAGAYDFTDKITFTYFDPKLGTLTKLRSTSRIDVKSISTNTNMAKSVARYKIYENIILLDISPSMMMEDYKPNRLGVSVRGIMEFLIGRTSCDIGLMTFSGDAKPYMINMPGICYSSELIRAIDFTTKMKGTAIGDAIWQAKNALKLSENSRIIIIGDGDNTAGTCTPWIAATIAKKYNIKVYTIGVGTKGLVPMGKDSDGRPQMYAESFSDSIFKNISLQTGGEYYWVKNADQISAALRSIFPDK